MAAPRTGEALLVLLTISHPDLAAPIRVTSDAVDTVSRGQTFVHFPFSITLPDERDDRPPAAQLSIDNVNRQIVAALRSIASAPTVTAEIVLGSQPDTVEAGPFEFSLRNAGYDAMTVAGELGYEELLDQRWPAEDFSPASHPGLF
jgi:hypothetical protein